MRLLLILTLGVFSAGCFTPWPTYSDHDLDSGNTSLGGGGYRVVKTAPNTYRITAITNKSKFEHPEIASKMWQDQAARICGGVNYTESNTVERVVRHDNLWIQDTDDWQNVKQGDVLCLGTGTDSIEPPMVGIDTSANEFLELITGNTLSGTNEKGTKFDVYYANDWSMQGIAWSLNGRTYKDSGIWRVNEKGELCEKWNKWVKGKLVCYRAYIISEDKIRTKAIGRSAEYLLTVQKGFPVSLGEPLVSTAGLTGTYVSENTGSDTSQFLSNYSGGKVTLVRNGLQVSGKFGVSGEIAGEIEGEKIRFDWWGPGIGNGVGMWTIIDNGMRMTGTWTNSGRHYNGIWNLKRIE